MTKKNIIIMTDLDGTFIKDSVKATAHDAKIMQKLQAKGFQIGVATGRSIQEIAFIEKQNNFTATYKIGFNGAVVVENGKTIYEQKIDDDIATRLITFLLENNIVFDALDGKKRIGNFYHERPETLWGMELICKENPQEELANKHFFKINIRPTITVVDELHQQLLKEFPELEISRIGNKRLEVTMQNISKGNSIEKIRKDHIFVVFGDAGNDISMFEKADVSYCMSHASEYIQKKATYVVDSFADGVKHALEHNIL